MSSRPSPKPANPWSFKLEKIPNLQGNRQVYYLLYNGDSTFYRMEGKKSDRKNPGKVAPRGNTLSALDSLLQAKFGYKAPRITADNLGHAVSVVNEYFEAGEEDNSSGKKFVKISMKTEVGVPDVSAPVPRHVRVPDSSKNSRTRATSRETSKPSHINGDVTMEWNTMSWTWTGQQHQPLFARALHARGYDSMDKNYKYAPPVVVYAILLEDTNTHSTNPLTMGYLAKLAGCSNFTDLQMFLSSNASFASAYTEHLNEFFRSTVTIREFQPPILGQPQSQATVTVALPGTPGFDTARSTAQNSIHSLRDEWKQPSQGRSSAPSPPNQMSEHSSRTSQTYESKDDSSKTSRGRSGSRTR